jgi:hypothetical protein
MPNFSFKTGNSNGQSLVTIMVSNGITFMVNKSP